MTRRDHSPAPRRGTPKKGATHARMRGRRSRERGSSPAATTARNRRALEALDRWQLQYATQAADPLNTLAAYTDWIRSEIRLIRKLWGTSAADAEYIGQMNATMQAWALQIDQQIRDKLGAS